MKGEVFIDGKKVANADNIIYGDTDSIMGVDYATSVDETVIAKPFNLADVVAAVTMLKINSFYGGASTATLLRRARYGGRKGRRATRRLLPYFKAVMHAKAALDQAGEEFGL